MSDTAGNGSPTDNANTGTGPLTKPVSGNVQPMQSNGPGAKMQTNGSSTTPVQLDTCGANNAAGLSGADVDKLRAGGASPGQLKWLYPYDGTVFPRGIGAPMLMWSGGGDAAYVHIQAKAFEFHGCYAKVSNGQIQLDQAVWENAGQKTGGRDDPFTVELTTLTGGTVTGPVRLHWNIAQATIKGSIYYNSYNSAMSSLGGGIVMRIPPNGSAVAFISTGCNGCHSVAANGSRLITEFFPASAQSYDLGNGIMANPTGKQVGTRGDFAAFYPDGSKYLAMSTVIDVARTFMTESLGASYDATLFDAATGETVPSTGIPTGALMPMFSPDGKHLVFNDNAIASAHGLAIMDYDVQTNTATAYKMLVQEDGQIRPGWPYMLPDNGGVVFVRTDSPDFSGNGAGITGPAGGGAPPPPPPPPGLPGAPPPPPPPGGPAAPTGATTATPPFSELNIVDVASGSVTLLAKAMGYNSPKDAGSNATYLPFGADDLHHNYFATVSPVAAGGYFWVFFDSLRNYGNRGLVRQLWGTALDIQPGGSYMLDPSHPAFYVPGQEFGTGNHRAFTALDPCKKDGDSCTTGIDCCGGACFIQGPQEEFGEAKGTCSPRMMKCAERDERCTSTADCCPATNVKVPRVCIAGFCADLPEPS